MAQTSLNPALGVGAVGDIVGSFNSVPVTAINQQVAATRSLEQENAFRRDAAIAQRAKSLIDNDDQIKQMRFDSAITNSIDPRTRKWNYKLAVQNGLKISAPMTEAWIKSHAESMKPFFETRGRDFQAIADAYSPENPGSVTYAKSLALNNGYDDDDGVPVNGGPDAWVAFKNAYGTRAEVVGGFAGKSAVALDLIRKMNDMPEGPEKERKRAELLQSGYIQSSGYGYTPEGRQFAESAAVRKIRLETPAKAEQAAAVVEAEIPARVRGAQAVETGKRVVGMTLSETSAERLGDFGASLSQLEGLVKSFKNPEAPQGPIAQLRRVNPYDWQAQAKQQLVASTKQLIGKALEGGVLRKEDEDKYNKILPTIADTYESASKKAENLQMMLGNAYRAKREALKAAGYYVDKFSGDLDSIDESGWQDIGGIKIRLKK